MLLQLDDRKAKAELAVAEAKFQAADKKANDDINERYAKAAAAVAKAELDVNRLANAEVPGSVPEVRLSELRLKCRETELSIEKAALDRKVAREEANVAKAEVQSAKVMVDRHQLFSPISGIVVDVRAHAGEAVQPTQPVIRVANLDTLWVQGDVLAGEHSRGELEGKTVHVDVVNGQKNKVQLHGKVIFVKPLTDPGDRYMVRAEIVNQPDGRSWLLYPGMQIEAMRIEP